MQEKITRRNALKALGTIAAGASTAGTLQAAPKPANAKARKRAIRLAHLTDIHVEPEQNAPEGMDACLDHVWSAKDRPDMILTGGDMVMDSSGATLPRTKTQWDVWDSIWNDHKGIAIRHCIGNHDVWGWDRNNSKATGDEPLYGKKWAMERFELSERYYSFDKAGWHFIALDGVFPNGNGYLGKLDDEQFEWLAGDLKQTPKNTPIMVWSHIPILSASAYMHGNNEKSGNWQVPGAWMHIDARRIIELFYKYPNVKLALSGHMHLLDRVEYNNVTYVCDGAVSGAWWKGDFHQTKPGYGMLDLYTDGTFEHEYVLYGGIPKDAKKG